MSIGDGCVFNYKNWTLCTLSLEVRKKRICESGNQSCSTPFCYFFFLQFCLWQAVHSALTCPKNVYYQLTKSSGRTFSEIARISLCPKMTTSFVCEVPRYPAGTLVNDHRQKAMHLTVHQDRAQGNRWCSQKKKPWLTGRPKLLLTNTVWTRKPGQTVGVAVVRNSIYAQSRGPSKDEQTMKVNKGILFSHKEKKKNRKICKIKFMWLYIEWGNPSSYVWIIASNCRYVYASEDNWRKSQEHRKGVPETGK